MRDMLQVVLPEASSRFPEGMTERKARVTTKARERFREVDGCGESLSDC